GLHDRLEARPAQLEMGWMAGEGPPDVGDEVYLFRFFDVAEDLLNQRVSVILIHEPHGRHRVLLPSNCLPAQSLIDDLRSWLSFARTARAPCGFRAWEGGSHSKCLHAIAKATLALPRGRP